MISCINGIFSKNVVIRLVDDTYLFLPNADVKILQSKYDTDTIDAIVDNSENFNVIMDIRLTSLIFYTLYRYGTHLLIYDIYANTTIDAIEFIAKYTKLPKQSINYNNIKPYSLINFIIQHHLDNQVRLDTNRVITCTLKSSTIKVLTMRYFIDNLVPDNRQCKTDQEKLHRYLDAIVTAINKNRVHGEIYKEPISSMVLLKALILMQDENSSIVL